MWLKALELSYVTGGRCHCVSLIQLIGSSAALLSESSRLPLTPLKGVGYLMDLYPRPWTSLIDMLGGPFQATGNEFIGRLIN